MHKHTQAAANVIPGVPVTQLATDPYLTVSDTTATVTTATSSTKNASIVSPVQEKRKAIHLTDVLSAFAVPLEQVLAEQVDMCI